MKMFLTLIVAALMAGTLTAADATTSATKAEKKVRRPNVMSAMADLRKAMTEDETKALRELETKVRSLAAAYKKDPSEANTKALKDQLAATYDARVAACQKVVDRTTDETEKAKFTAIVTALTKNKEANLEKTFAMVTTAKPPQPKAKGEKKHKK